MSFRFPLAVADDAFIDTAPHRYVHVVELGAPVPRVWEVLTADDALVSWAAAVTAARWISPQPFGVGTIREVTLAGAIGLRERFYRWDEGSRMTFTVDAASVPGLRRFAEDISVRPTATGTELRWIFAFEAKPALVPLLAAVRPLTRSITKAIAHSITDKYPIRPSTVDR